MDQLKLGRHQIEAFYSDGCAENQVKHFTQIFNGIKETEKHWVVDIGGGCGYFAKLLNHRVRLSIKVLDTDLQSIQKVRELNNQNILGVLGDALHPEIEGNEGIVCFNLILHHLVGINEEKTRLMQKKALTLWKDNADYIFINEYVYDSWFGNLSGRLIYEVTKSKTLSTIGQVISKIAPSLYANTFGVGVRFRSHSEWIKLFEECGFTVVSKIYNEPEHVSLPRRLLMIKEIRRDSFLLSS
jgi:hypothetical protein